MCNRGGFLADIDPPYRSGTTENMRRKISMFFRYYQVRVRASGGRRGTHISSATAAPKHEAV